MGEVYAADDLTLGRRVALKVLPDHLTGDLQALERFRREARAAATINHPNIVTVHSIEEADGTHFLTMEVVDGVALDASMKTPVMPLDRLLDTGIAIADALGAAHERGIVHRDLTPRNVMVTKDGRVKVLDFGLARLRDADSPSVDQHGPVTTTTPLTGAHQIVGTPAYMSPEQAEGKPLDHRSDLFSLGTMLYEMATGERPFKGDSTISILSSIVRDVPRPLVEFSPVQPRELWRIVRRALVKDVDGRYQSAKDLRNDLRELKQDSQVTAPLATTLSSVPASSRWRLGAAVGAAIAAAAAWMAFARGDGEGARPAEAPRQVVRFQITHPMPAMPRPEFAYQSVAISRDGAQIAYGTPSENASQSGGLLYLRRLDGTTRPVSDLAPAFVPAFSPSGDRLAFRSGTTRYYVVSVRGGAPVLVAEPAIGSISTAAWWGESGLIYENYGTLFRTPLAGAAEIFAKPEESNRETFYYGASTTPDGKAVVFSIVREDTASFDTADIAVKDLTTGLQKTLLRGGMSPQVTTTGHLLFGRAGVLHAVEVDTTTWEVRGSPVAVVTDIVTEPTDGVAPYAVSNNGTLVYLQGHAQTYRRKVLVVDRRGRETVLLEGPYNAVRADPTGRYLALSAYGANVRTWLYDLRQQTTRLFTETRSNEGPTWSRDGKRLAHVSTRGGEPTVYVTEVDSPTREIKLRSGPDVSSFMSFSIDDRDVIFHDFGDIYRVRADGSADKEAFVASGAREIQPAASPDGRWLAFSSDDTGRSEIYVVPYATPTRRLRITNTGALYPRWSKRGRELCYRLGSVPSQIACVAISDAGTPIGEAVVVVKREEPVTWWDVSPDGERFYIIGGEIEGWKPTAPLQVVVNWFEELRAKMAQTAP